MFLEILSYSSSEIHPTPLSVCWNVCGIPKYTAQQVSLRFSSSGFSGIEHVSVAGLFVLTDLSSALRVARSKNKNLVVVGYGGLAAEVGLLVICFVFKSNTEHDQLL